MFRRNHKYGKKSPHSKTSVLKVEKVRNIRGVVFTKITSESSDDHVKYDTTDVNVNPPSGNLRHRVMNSQEKTYEFAHLSCLV